MSQKNGFISSYTFGSTIVVANIKNTTQCHLAKTIRKRLKKVHIDKLKVVFSSEIQDESSLKMTDGTNYKRSFYGTNSYMPGLFGLYAAETVIRYLLKKNSNDNGNQNVNRI